MSERTTLILNLSCLRLDRYFLITRPGSQPECEWSAIFTTFKNRYSAKYIPLFFPLSCIHYHARRFIFSLLPCNRVGVPSLFGGTSSHTTVRAVRHTARFSSLSVTHCTGSGYHHIPFGQCVDSLMRDAESSCRRCANSLFGYSPIPTLYFVQFHTIASAQTSFVLVSTVSKNTF